MTSVAALSAALGGRLAASHALVDLAERHHVDALLAVAAHPGTPPDVGERLQRGLAARQALTALRDLELTHLLGVLDAAGVAAVVIKGAHLRHALYRLPALRPSADTDLLVAEEDRERCAGVLLGAGYARAVHTRGSLILGQAHFQRRDEHGVTHPLDVHWRVVSPLILRHVLPPHDLLADSVPIPALGAAARGPSWPHALLLGCVHLAAHHRGDPILLWLHDLSVMAARLEARDQDEVERMATEARVTGVCAAALEAARRHLDSPTLEALSSRLAAASRQGRPEPSLAALSRRTALGDVWLDVRAADGWREARTLLREHLCPDADYMRARAGGHGWLPLLYARRAVAGGARWITAGVSDRISAAAERRAGSAAASAFPSPPGTTR